MLDPVSRVFAEASLEKDWKEKIGLNNREGGSAMKEIQQTVENASDWIWLKR